MAVFSLMYNNKRLESFPIGMGDTFMIGRQDANDIVIDNLAVSFHHAKVESIGDEFLLIDLHCQTEPAGHHHPGEVDNAVPSSSLRRSKGPKGP
jgi:pSer/pThr/pTyr-binding forkhead associated (FHA) protein